MNDQPTLFDMTQDPKLRPRPRAVNPSQKVRYLRYRGANRILCGDCTRLIHELGQDKAPYPLRARWKSINGKGDAEFLCHDHKRIRAGE